MTAWKLLQISWNFDPVIIIGCTVLLALYLFAVKCKINRTTVNFTLGVVVLFLALVSPIDRIGEDYLFSVHMIQHMMLGILAPLLLVAGIPAALIQPLLKFPFVASIERVLSYPPLALIVASATFWLWHLPTLYNMTLENESFHIFEHLTLIVTGTLLWWPVLKPIAEGRLAPMPAIIYLGGAAFLSTILGIIFTVSETPYYAGYAHPDDEFGALKMIREGWGLDQIADQKLGGAVMWEPAGAIFLVVIMLKMIEWYKVGTEDSAVPQIQRSAENVATK